MEMIHTALYNMAAFVVVLSTIVFIHEFGHYYIAKLSGVKIEVFSIGFGKEIFGWNDKSGTRWKFCWIPFGGYVKMFGDINPVSAPDSDKIASFTEEEKKNAFHEKPLYIKAAIVAAGPIANFILSIAILIFFFFHYGKPVTLPEVSSVLEKSPAAEAGILPEDFILKLDNEDIESFSDISRIISLNTGTTIDVTLQRKDKILNLKVTPKITERKDAFGNDIKIAMIGVASTEISYAQIDFPSSVKEAFKETYNLSSSTLKAIGQIITGKRSAKELTGPIGIAKYSGQSAKQGVQAVLWFIIVLSINLGLVNLFPIPALDGGHLLYYAIEAVRGKPMADRLQSYGIKIGVALVISLAIFAIINDFRNLNLF